MNDETLKDLERMNEIYYRVIHSDGPVVVTMQWFDEYDYDQKRFLTEETFETEELAEAWIDATTGRAFRAIQNGAESLTDEELGQAIRLLKSLGHDAFARFLTPS